MKFTTTAESAGSANIFTYGLPGVGKTRLISTAPNPIIISSEKGLMSIAEFNIPVIEITDIDDFQEAYDFIMGSKKAKQFETICIDSISDIAEACLTSLKRQHKDPRQAYGELQDMISDLCRKFRDIDQSTYVVGKAQQVMDATNRATYLPSMPSKRLSNDLPYMFDIVTAMRMGEDDDGTFRYLQTQPDTEWYAKDRSGMLEEMEPPNLSTLFKKIKSKEKKHGKGKKGKKE